MAGPDADAAPSLPVTHPRDWRGIAAVHKFGGTSVQSSEAMRQVRGIVAGLADEVGGAPLAVVVSAMGGKPKVTDMLIDAVNKAAVNDMAAARALLAAVRAKHEDAIADLLTGPERGPARDALVRALRSDLDDISHLLTAVSLMRSADGKLTGVIAGYGEQWSARMMAALLSATDTPPGGRKWAYVDARSVLVVEDEGVSTGVAILWDESEARLRAFVDAHRGCSLVITGFIASTKAGGVTTLGRDGSDYSASVFARLLEATEVTIWTDVSGVFSADPRVVKDAYVLPEVSYNEAAELAHFGAKVVHPKTMQPALARLDWREDARSIPIFIRNTFAPRDKGTRIFETSGLTTAREVCGVSAMRGMCLVNVQGRGMLGIPGVSARLFQALHSMSVNVTAIAQASSEQSISVVVLDADGDRARNALADVFRPELDAGHIEAVQLERGVAVVAVVGDGMSHRPGISGKVMGALGHAGVNVRAIAQGCNETNITTVVDGSQALLALRAVHAAFLASLTVAVGVVARSTAVADQLLSRFDKHAQATRDRFGVDARVHALLRVPGSAAAPAGAATAGDGGDAVQGAGAVAAAGRMLVAKERSALDLSRWQMDMASDGEAPNLDAFTARLLESDVPLRVIVDASDSPDAARRHCEWLARGIHVVTNNSAALCGSARDYESLLKNRREAGAGATRYVYGTTYGDWLPVASTVTTLLASGDQVLKVEGVLSASVSYVLNRVSPAPSQGSPATFSQAVRDAYELGLFEQDPTDDLSGLHSARQLLCLARDLGYHLELDAIAMDPPLAPGVGLGDKELLVGAAAIEEAMVVHNACISARAETAATKGCVLRFVASLEHNPASPKRPHVALRLRELPASHPFAALTGSSIAFSFLTEEHWDQPLVISGAISLTSCVNALYSDLIRLARTLDERARDRGPLAPVSAVV